jgi:hypothetical protein
MKKISILLAAGSVLVVGGVYAGWSYSQGAVAAANDDIAAVMTAETVSSSKGTLAVNTSATKFEIDDITGDEAYLPVLVIKNAPVITFTPSVGADTSVINDGITLEWNITIHEDHADWKYDSTFTNGTPDKDIFKLSGETYVIPDANVTKETNGSFSYIIPREDILDAVELTLETEKVLLDTKAKYDSFKDDLMSGAHFVLHVQEKTSSI